MMVLTSVYLSVSSSLPSTANIKPVELWLLFNLAYPFLVIITNTLLEVFIIESALNSKDLFQKRKVKKIKVVPDKLKVHQDSSLTKLVMKGISLYVNPLLYMVTSIGYFVFYLSIPYNQDTYLMQPKFKKRQKLVIYIGKIIY